MSDTGTGEQSMPWFLKMIILVAILVVLFIVAIDLLTFAGAL
ncbi:hypothetical protein [Halomicrobium mukohataei]|uniref:Uncharacterized protein n=1 Tax=Halomicrobium mukohataei (strain ATCC 700874 / DSM 12286 / JCM 9738 / NCIMB 13541) TaxID=485914 RepID=C7P561_HALMD|nr:hypothetical protein [Halomicrobium mukohataei]ACV49456.1 hypothetical protein Hmuk_3370 [Halomicrobium mukohataei DSM 12286]